MTESSEVALEVPDDPAELAGFISQCHLTLTRGQAVIRLSENAEDLLRRRGVAGSDAELTAMERRREEMAEMMLGLYASTIEAEVKLAAMNTPEGPA